MISQTRQKTTTNDKYILKQRYDGEFAVIDFVLNLREQNPSVGHLEADC